MTGEAVDLYHWQPSEQFEYVVASLYQMPVDPYEEPSGHGRWTTGAATCWTTSSACCRSCSRRAAWRT